MNRWLITGGGGLLGTELARLARAAGITVSTPTRAELDITDVHATADAAAGFDVVINAAAWTAVDDAQTHETQAFWVNAVGPANLARAARRANARFIQISTDYVFSGSADQIGSAYREDAAIYPQTAYGRTKAAGEWAALALGPAHTQIVRTAWLYGAAGANFVSTMARMAATRPYVEVVTDEVGQPTWTVDCAHQVLALAQAEAPAGIYHATSQGQTSWFDFAREIFAQLGHDPERVHPTTSAAFGRPAPRPAWSVLAHETWATAGLAPIRHWREALTEALTTTELAVVRDH